MVERGQLPSFSGRGGCRRTISSSIAAAAALMISSFLCAFNGVECKGEGVPFGSSARNFSVNRRFLALGENLWGLFEDSAVASKIPFQERDAEDSKPQTIDDLCSKSAIVLYQGDGAPLPNGIPTYTVEILNTCPSGCHISSIHVACGWFSTARLINPAIFRRVGYNNCLVNNGRVLLPGRSITFQYANTFRYPMSVSAVTCA
ncbi:TPD1 protein-like protein 1 [Nymphaea thermarum]|nr:TPD1 protein-like protein 1 [Nymphaea thermarum]